MHEITSIFLKICKTMVSFMLQNMLYKTIITKYKQTDIGEPKACVRNFRFTPVASNSARVVHSTSHSGVTLSGRILQAHMIFRDNLLRDSFRKTLVVRTNRTRRRCNVFSMTNNSVRKTLIWAKVGHFITQRPWTSCRVGLIEIHIARPF